MIFAGQTCKIAEIHFGFVISNLWMKKKIQINTFFNITNYSKSTPKIEKSRATRSSVSPKKILEAPKPAGDTQPSSVARPWWTLESEWKVSNEGPVARPFYHDRARVRSIQLLFKYICSPLFSFSPSPPSSHSHVLPFSLSLNQ